MTALPQSLRAFSAEQYQNSVEAIYRSVCDLPIVSPHGHCEASWFANNTAFSDPAELLISPDHYVFRMLYSQGVALADLGVGVPAELRKPRGIFRLFARHWHCFLGTPSRQWLNHTFSHVFGLEGELSPATADHFYDTIDAAIKSPEFLPRALYERFNIAVLATTDGALDPLSDHRTIRESGWQGRVLPTFRPDALLNPALGNFGLQLQALAELTNCDTGDYAAYLQALRQRRAFFKAQGATATDHDVPQLHTNWLSTAEIETLFQRVQQGDATADEKTRFYGHMLIEMALMSADDGMVMQLHAGSRRNTNQALHESHGANMGADMPQPTPWLVGLEPLLNVVGIDARLSLLLFSLDESCYARELAPMAGHWPAVKLGPPWWFHDSANGIRRYLDQVVETAGYCNLAGFNDDTRAFLSIPARHDVWRQGVSLHLSTQIQRGQMNAADALHLAKQLCHDHALSAYRMELN